MSEWKIALDQWGRPIVEVDGVELEGVAGIGVQSVPGQPPALTLYAQADVSLTGSGIVQVVDAGSSKAAVLEFLATLDADSFEKKMLEGAGGFGGPSSTGEMALSALRAEAELLT